MNIDELLVRPTESLRAVMSHIDRGTLGIALVVGADGRLVTTVTDGDVRRAILAGLTLDAPAESLVERKADSPYPHPITAPVGTDRQALVALLQRHSIRHLPILDTGGRPVDLVTAEALLPEDVVPLKAVVMAGGMGTRLRPLTDDVPKPMLPVGGRPLLEVILEQLQGSGIHEVSISTHYKSDVITDHFGDGREFGVRLNYLNEDRPMGTAGALALLPEPSEPLLVVNGDILTQLDYRSMLAFHREHNAELTVAVRQFDLEVPYGVLETEGFAVRTIREKPTYSFFVNAGIYLLEASAHRRIPRGRRFDMTDLIELLVGEGRTVVSFPVVEYWLDVGQPSDYDRAQRDFDNGGFDWTGEERGSWSPAPGGSSEAT